MDYFNHDLKKRYEHTYPPDDEAGIQDVLVKDGGRCVGITIVFYDTRCARSHLPQQLSYNSLEDSIDVREIHHGFWETGMICAHTPAVEGLITELQNIDKWVEHSVCDKPSYIRMLVQSLRGLTD